MYHWILNIKKVTFRPMEFGKRVMNLRKERKLSQSELAAKAGIHPNVLGRYERGDAKPFVEVAAKIAKILGVSIDYLAGNTDVLFDKKTVDRILDIQQLSEKDAEHLYALMDAFLRDAKTKKNYSPK